MDFWRQWMAIACFCCLVMPSTVQSITWYIHPASDTAILYSYTRARFRFPSRTARDVASTLDDEQVSLYRIDFRRYSLGIGLLQSRCCPFSRGTVSHYPFIGVEGRKNDYCAQFSPSWRKWIFLFFLSIFTWRYLNLQIAFLTRIFNLLESFKLRYLNFVDI